MLLTGRASRVVIALVFFLPVSVIAFCTIAKVIGPCSPVADLVFMAGVDVMSGAGVGAADVELLFVAGPGLLVAAPVTAATVCGE